MLGFLILLVVIIAAEIICCFNSEFCLLDIASSYPSLSKVMGVKETDLGFKKGNFTRDKNFNLITVSGEIAEVEKGRLTIILGDGSKKTVSVKKGSKFVVFKTTSGEESEGENYTFDGNNLEDFLSPGHYLINAGFSGSEIFSDYSDAKGKLEFPIVIMQ